MSLDSQIDPSHCSQMAQMIADIRTKKRFVWQMLARCPELLPLLDLRLSAPSADKNSSNARNLPGFVLLIGKVCRLHRWFRAGT